MNTITSSRTVHRGSFRIMQALNAFLSDLARRHRTRRDEALLLGKPDHILRDIGIGRSEIPSVVRRGKR